MKLAENPRKVRNATKERERIGRAGVGGCILAERC